MSTHTTMTDAQYVAHRAKDAADILTLMRWAPGNVPGVLQCRLYGHSILWDIDQSVLHAGGWCSYEVLPARASDIECFGTLAELLAWILRRNW